jgi:hypothetical protein
LTAAMLIASVGSARILAVPRLGQRTGANFGLDRE